MVHAFIISGNINIKILYQDDDIIVIDKPAGLVVNESETTKDKTLQYILKEQGLIDESSVDDYVEVSEYDKKKEFLDRQGIVHRLDADTSGNLVIARNIESFVNLQNQFKERTTKKGYIALTKGKIRNLELGGEFIVDAPIGRNPKSRHKFAIVEETGKAAQTEFKLIEIINHNNQFYSLFECYPFTGRTHQIRVHLTAMSVPVLGDKIYSGHNSNKEVFKRQFLHAFYTKFIHPKTEKEMVVTSELPEDFKEALSTLKS